MVYEEGKLLNKSQWKQAINTLVENIEISEWKTWLREKGDQNGWLTVTKKNNNLEPYVERSHPSLLPLFAAIRLGTTNAAGDKLKRSEEKCRLCGEGRETIQHLLLSCQKLKVGRQQFWEKRERPMTLRRQWETIVSDLPNNEIFIMEVDRVFRRITGERLVSKRHWEPPDDQEEQMEEWIERGELADLARFVLNGSLE